MHADYHELPCRLTRALYPDRFVTPNLSACVLLCPVLLITSETNVWHEQFQFSAIYELYEIRTCLFVGLRRCYFISFSEVYCLLARHMSVIRKMLLNNQNICFFNFSHRLRLRLIGRYIWGMRISSAFHYFFFHAIGTRKISQENDRVHNLITIMFDTYEAKLVVHFLFFTPGKDVRIVS